MLVVDWNMRCGDRNEGEKERETQSEIAKAVVHLNEVCFISVVVRRKSYPNALYGTALLLSVSLQVSK